MERDVVVTDAELPGRRLQAGSAVAEQIHERIDSHGRVSDDHLRPLKCLDMLRMSVQQQQHVRRRCKIELKLVADAKKHACAPSYRTSYRLFRLSRAIGAP